MSSSTFNYNWLGKRYPQIVNLVYGPGIYKTQRRIIEQAGSSVLVVGGGAGTALKGVKLREAQHVAWLDHSKIMMEQARKNVPKSNAVRIEFIEQDFFNWTPKRKYETVLFPFFLDQFRDQTIVEMCLRSTELLQDGGRLVIFDFEKPATLPEKVHEKTVVAVFSILSRIDAGHIPDWASLLANDFFIEKTTGPKGIFFRTGIYALTAK